MDHISLVIDTIMQKLAFNGMALLVVMASAGYLFHGAHCFTSVARWSRLNALNATVATWAARGHAHELHNVTAAFAAQQSSLLLLQLWVSHNNNNNNTNDNNNHNNNNNNNGLKSLLRVRAWVCVPGGTTLLLLAVALL